MIKVGDIVLHSLSGLYFRCENKKQERWMNMNEFYSTVPKDSVPKSYFDKNLWPLEKENTIGEKRTSEK